MAEMVPSAIRQPPSSSTHAYQPALDIDDHDFPGAVPTGHRYDTGLLDILAGKPHPIWGIRRLWSLWDMINFSLSDFVWALRLISQELQVAVSRTATSASAMISDEDRKRFEENFEYIGR